MDESIRARVRRAAVELGFDFDQRRKSSLILFLLANRPMLHPFHSHIMAGAEQYCAARGWEMCLQTYHYLLDEKPKNLRIPPLLENRELVRGVILAGTNSGGALEALHSLGVEVAVFGNNVVGDWDPANEAVVYSDQAGGAREMTQYLQSLGHRDIWYIGTPGWPWMRRSAEGYLQAMESAGLKPRIHWALTDGSESGYLGTKSLVSQGEAISAILLGSDKAAEGTYRALRDLNLRIPVDVSVCAVSDACDLALHPALTVVRQFPEVVGHSLAEMVLDRAINAGGTPQHRTIPTQIVRRDSCAQKSTAR